MKEDRFKKQNSEPLNDKHQTQPVPEPQKHELKHAAEPAAEPQHSHEDAHASHEEPHKFKLPIPGLVFIIVSVIIGVVLYFYDLELGSKKSNKEVKAGHAPAGSHGAKAEEPAGQPAHEAVSETHSKAPAVHEVVSVSAEHSAESASAVSHEIKSVEPAEQSAHGAVSEGAGETPVVHELEPVAQHSAVGEVSQPAAAAVSHGVKSEEPATVHGIFSESVVMPIEHPVVQEAPLEVKPEVPIEMKTQEHTLPSAEQVIHQMPAAGNATGNETVVQTEVSTAVTAIEHTPALEVPLNESTVEHTLGKELNDATTH